MFVPKEDHVTRGIREEEVEGNNGTRKRGITRGILKVEVKDLMGRRWNHG